MNIMRGLNPLTPEQKVQILVKDKEHGRKVIVYLKSLGGKEIQHGTGAVVGQYHSITGGYWITFHTLEKAFGYKVVELPSEWENKKINPLGYNHEHFIKVKK